MHSGNFVWVLQRAYWAPGERWAIWATKKSFLHLVQNIVQWNCTAIFNNEELKIMSKLCQMSLMFVNISDNLFNPVFPSWEISAKLVYHASYFCSQNGEKISVLFDICVTYVTMEYVICGWSLTHTIDTCFFKRSYCIYIWSYRKCSCDFCQTVS